MEDTELQGWQREWGNQTEPPQPELKRKIKRQNRRTVRTITMIGACLACATVAALLSRNSYVGGLAVGLWSTILFVGSYAWWVRRGSWKPAAQTTLAYLELSHKRAVAWARTTGLLVNLSRVVVFLCLVLAAWQWKDLPGRIGAIIEALAVALLVRVFVHRQRSSDQEVEKTRTLLDQIRE